LRIERNTEGGVAVKGPGGRENAEKNAKIKLQLKGWATMNATGRAVDTSAGYLLPNGAIRSPDASWANMVSIYAHGSLRNGKILNSTLSLAVSRTTKKPQQAKMR